MLEKVKVVIDETITFRINDNVKSAPHDDKYLEQILR